MLCGSASLPRQETAKPNGLHKHTLSITFKSGDEIGQSIVPWMESQISTVGDDYAASKKVIRETAGYQEVHSDHELGLLEDLPVENFIIHDQRFGIQAANPTISGKAGRVSIGQREPKSAVLRIIRSDGERLDIPAQVTASTLISPKSEAFKVRIQAAFF